MPGSPSSTTLRSIGSLSLLDSLSVLEVGAGQVLFSLCESQKGGISPSAPGNFIFSNSTIGNIQGGVNRAASDFGLGALD